MDTKVDEKPEDGVQGYLQKPWKLRVNEHKKLSASEKERRRRSLRVKLIDSDFKVARRSPPEDRLYEREPEYDHQIGPLQSISWAKEGNSRLTYASQINSTFTVLELKDSEEQNNLYFISNGLVNELERKGEALPSTRKALEILVDREDLTEVEKNKGKTKDQIMADYGISGGKLTFIYRTDESAPLLKNVGNVSQLPEGLRVPLVDVIQSLPTAHVPNSDGEEDMYTVIMEMANRNRGVLRRTGHDYTMAESKHIEPD